VKWKNEVKQVFLNLKLAIFLKHEPDDIWLLEIKVQNTPTT